VEMLTKSLSHLYGVLCIYIAEILLHEYTCEYIIECLRTVVGVVSVMEISWERDWNPHKFRWGRVDRHPVLTVMCVFGTSISAECCNVIF